MFGCILLVLLALSGDAPLRLTSFGAESDPDRVVITLENRSDKPIVAYTLILKIARGSTTETQIISSVRLPGPALLPGRQRTQYFSVSDKELIRSVVLDSIDAVLFGDGSTYGPQNLRITQQMLAEVSGITQERRRLLKVLQEEGAQAVLDDLGRGEQGLGRK